MHKWSRRAPSRGAFSKWITPPLLGGNKGEAGQGIVPIFYIFSLLPHVFFTLTRGITTKWRNMCTTYSTNYALHNTNVDLHILYSKLVRLLFPNLRHHRCAFIATLLSLRFLKLHPPIALSLYSVFLTAPWHSTRANARKYKMHIMCFTVVRCLFIYIFFFF